MKLPSPRYRHHPARERSSAICGTSPARQAFAIAGDRDTLVHEVRAGRPVIVGLLLPYGQRRVQSHYEVIVAVHPTNDRFVTINPSSGWRVRSWTDLDAEWRPVGRPALVVLGPE